LKSSKYTDKLLQDIQTHSFFNGFLETHVPPKTESQETSPIDAAQLYKTIKEKVTKQDFELFGSIIGKFNNGTMTVKDTLGELEKILKDEELSKLMGRLICEAVQ
jgi:hypothetical protein